MKVLTALASILLLGFGLESWAGTAKGANKPVRWTNQYDHYFQKYSKHYFGLGYDWTWFKAQAIAESRLDPNAKSRVGARGLMQIMPATFKEIRGANPQFDDIRSPKWNIAAGIYYDRYLYDRWAKFQDFQRLYLAFASYNAGHKGIRRAMRKAKKPVKNWPQVAPHAPAQTRHYLRRILYLKQSEVILPKKRGRRMKLSRTASAD